MNLQRRELITIGIGAAIVVVVLLWRVGGAAGAVGTGGRIAQSLDRLDEYARLRQTVETTGKQMGLEIPRVGPAYQEVLIRRELEQLAGKNQLQISRTALTGSRERRETDSARPMPLSIEAAGQFASVIAFINDLEHSKVPFTIRDVQIQAGTAGGEQPGGAPGPRGGGGPKPADGSVRVTMQLETYLFPKVHVSAEAVKTIEASLPSPPPMPPPEMTMPPSGSPSGAPPGMQPGSPGRRPKMSPGGPGGPGGPAGMSPEKMAALKAKQEEIMRVMKEDPVRGRKMVEELQKEMGGGQ